MKEFLAYIRKEFAHIFRDRQTMLILLAMPVVQILLFGYAITTEIHDTPIAIVDKSNDEYSKAIIQKIEASQYFTIYQYYSNEESAQEAFKTDDARILLVFPPAFGNDLIRSGEASVQCVMDASNPNEASITENYMRQIILSYQKELSSSISAYPMIIPHVKMLYNPSLKSAYTFVPGVMGLILLLVCTLMTSVSIVREKERGTMEILLVSPSRPAFIIISKSIPYFILSLMNVLSIIALSMFVLGVPVEGSILLLIGVSLLYILVSLAVGTLISTLASDQQQAMIGSLLGLMLPTILLSGLMFPIDNMPLILRFLSNIVPATWYISAIKSIMIKGLGFAFVWKEVLILCIMLFALLGLSIKRFKVRL